MGEVGSRSLEEMYTSKQEQGGDPCLMNDPKHIMTFPFLLLSSLVFSFSTLPQWSHFLKLPGGPSALFELYFMDNEQVQP